MPSPMGERGQGSIVAVHGDPANPERVTSYRIMVSMGDGRRVFRRAQTKRKAEEVRRALVDERDLDLDPTSRTLAGYPRSWIAELSEADRRIRPTTLRHYKGIVEGHIIPSLDPQARLPLRRLNERRIQAWLDAETGSARSLHHYRAVLRRALNVALRRRYIVRNPAIGVELPEPRKGVAQPLTEDEVRRLLLTTASDRLGLLWRLAVVTGLREAELLALGWDDVKAGTLSVTAQIQRIVTDKDRREAERTGTRVRGSWVRSRTKAARSLTRIALDPETVRMIERHRKKMAKEREPSWTYYGLLFTTRAGKPLHGRYVVDELHDALDRSGIPRRRFHDLRHTNATLMRAAGVPEEARMARLGHSTTEMARHYGQASETQDRAAVTALAASLKRRPAKAK